MTAEVAGERRGRFGEYGGAYVPETLVPALQELEAGMELAFSDPAFLAELATWLRDYAGRPTPVTPARRLTAEAGGAQIWLKREDLLHTGAHKLNNALGQALLAKRMGKRRVIAETGAGQHGVAAATVAARFGMQCVVYMGSEDIKRQAQNVFRMKLLGAEVVPVESGSKTLKDALNEAMRDWVTNVGNTFYIIGTVAGPHPYPMMVRDFQSVIGRECLQQMPEMIGRQPDVIIACVGGGSNAMGIFYPYLSHESVKLVGVEAAGEGIAVARRKEVAGLTVDDELGVALELRADDGGLHGERLAERAGEQVDFFSVHGHSFGSLSTRSAMMPRWTSADPP